ncbi:MAG: hypothetical protein OQJ89_09110, partial [Kangiellaceae bacterium]|nr:hypothetical protein [Kangiellaceae bacterium]
EKDVKDRHVGPLEVQKLVWLERDQMSKRGVTLGMIETVADRITRYYREHGFILAKAYIPQQQVRDGVVSLSLLLGVLGETKVNNNSLYDSEILEDVFDDVMTKPVTSDAIEERLFLLNDYPGLTTQGFFEAGGQVGDTRLNINVVSEDSYQSNLRFDNHGTEETGEVRAYGEFFWNNPTSTADKIHLGVLKANTIDSSVEGSDTTYGQIRYSSNIIGPRIDMSLGYAQNAFVVGRTDTEFNSIQAEISGETIISDLGIGYKLKRGRVENYTFRFGFENIESKIAIGAISGILDDEVQNAILGFNFELLQESSKMLHQGSLRLKQGKFVEGQDSGQDEKYSVLQADYSLLSFWNIPFTDIETRSILRSSLQYTDNTLSSINRFTLGGPTRARGFDAKIFSADTALHIGVDLFFNAPEFLDVEVGDNNLRNMIAPFIFIDAAYGESYSLSLAGNTEFMATTKSSLASVGVGLQFSFSPDFNAKLQIASATSESYESPNDLDLSSGENDTKVLFELQYSL